MRLIILLLLSLALPAQAGFDRYARSIVEAARVVDVNPVTLAIIANVETRFSNVRANAPQSTAEGLFQFTDQTWAYMLSRYGEAYNVPQDTSKYDYQANALMAAVYLKHNQLILQKLLRREPTPAELYLAHFLGSTGIRTLMTAKTTDLASNVVAYAYPNNRPLFLTKEGKQRTVGQFRDHMNYRFNNLYQEYELSVSRVSWGYNLPSDDTPTNLILVAKSWVVGKLAEFNSTLLTANTIIIREEG